MDLTTVSSLRACRTFKTVVKRKFFTNRSDHYVISCVSDAQNCGKTQIFLRGRATLSSLRACRINCGKTQILRLTMATLSSLRACRMLKAVAKRNFFTYRSGHYVISCVSDAQNCGKMQILAPARATFSSLRACRTLKTVVNANF